LNTNGTIKVDFIYPELDTHSIVEGRYSVMGDTIKLFDVVIDGETLDADTVLSYPFSASGATARINGIAYARMTAADAAAILAK